MILAINLKSLWICTKMFCSLDLNPEFSLFFHEICCLVWFGQSGFLHKNEWYIEAQDSLGKFEFSCCCAKKFFGQKKSEFIDLELIVGSYEQHSIHGLFIGVCEKYLSFTSNNDIY
jgi:hypothetical protein